jgi:hypothetical protein
MLSAAATVFDVAVDSWARVRRFGYDVVFGPPAIAKEVREAAQIPQAVGQARAQAYVARLVKRDRPVLTASWRMCPST